MRQVSTCELVTMILGGRKAEEPDAALTQMLRPNIPWLASTEFLLRRKNHRDERSR